MTTLGTWLSDFRDLVSPRYCATCGKRLNRTEQKLCGKCLFELHYTMYQDFYDNRAAHLFWGKIPVERVYAHIAYGQDRGSHQLLMKLKYYHRPDIGVWMGRLMASELADRGFFEGIDCIMAVPLHWKRQLRRGYNQSLMLARSVADVTGLPLLRREVRRVYNNPSQTHLSYQERVVNVKDIFRAKRTLPYRHLLLIDDVLTTGSTLTSCAHAILKRNPNMHFSILTLAKA